MNLALGKRIRTIAVAAIVGPLLQGGAAPGRYSNPDRGAEQTLAQMKTEKSSGSCGRYHTTAARGGAAGHCDERG
jgi:hypothetical protein